jgi:cytoplasmic iron level regulating protein YaaA (DUF328/UPF0246 family)
MITVIHTSKTMRPATEVCEQKLGTPCLIVAAEELQACLRTLTVDEIQNMMRVSGTLAETTRALTSSWTTRAVSQRAAIDSFLGDIYSGLQVSVWAEEDRQYANEKMRILSGLYGILRPLDGIFPYRFEMGYKIPRTSFGGTYAFWGDLIARTIPSGEIILNLSAVEYGKVLTKYIEQARIITPRFLTMSLKTGEPTFVVVHAKIARGAFAGWVVRNRIDTPDRVKEFSEIGYRYDAALSTPQEPVFLCEAFEGLGLSVRLT